LFRELPPQERRESITVAVPIALLLAFFGLWFAFPFAMRLSRRRDLAPGTTVCDSMQPAE